MVNKIDPLPTKAEVRRIAARAIYSDFSNPLSVIPPEMLPQYLKEVEGTKEEFERVEAKVLQKEVVKRTVDLMEANRRYDRAIGAIGDFAKVNAEAFGFFLGGGLLPGVAKAVGTYEGVMSGFEVTSGRRGVQITDVPDLVTGENIGVGRELSTGERVLAGVNELISVLSLRMGGLKVLQTNPQTQQNLE
jgi:hypothetical protein